MFILESTVLTVHHHLWLTEQTIDERNTSKCEENSAGHFHVPLVSCDINLEGDIRKYIIAIIQSECMISTGEITINIILQCYKMDMNPHLQL